MIDHHNSVIAYFTQFVKDNGVDRAVIYGTLAKTWSLLAGPVTVLLITSKFTPVLQGYYYTFATIIALQVFIELGLGVVIVQFSSHEWSKLRFDESREIVGDSEALSRLTSIARITFKWYFIGGILLIVGLIIGGYVFFSNKIDQIIEWKNPWIFLCVVSGLNIWLVPFWSLLEGCNQVRSLYKYRFFQGLISSIVTWIALTLGLQLWTGGISNLSIVVFAVIYLLYTNKRFIITLFILKPKSSQVSWKSEILPMQWRIAVSWLSGYFIYSIIVPVLFRWQGPIIAGQVGMSWTIVSSMGVAQAYFSPKVPRLGILIAQKKFKELDSFFFKSSVIYIIICIFIALLLFVLVLVLNSIDIPMAKFISLRILPLKILGIFILAQLMMIISVPFSNYMFAHKKNPLALLTVINAILTGTSTILFGKYVSAESVIVGFALIQLSIVPIIFIIWYRFRKKWHSEKNLD